MLSMSTCLQRSVPPPALRSARLLVVARAGKVKKATDVKKRAPSKVAKPTNDGSGAAGEHRPSAGASDANPACKIPHSTSLQRPWPAWPAWEGSWWRRRRLRTLPQLEREP